MAEKTENQIGSVHVSPVAIATIASHALLTSYGVVGMASRNAINELAATLTRDPHHGIGVRVFRGQIIIDAYVVIQHGTHIKTVAESVINAVRFQVEKSIGIPVQQVIVHVQGLRVLDVD